jgi:hypothetical protein
VALKKTTSQKLADAVSPDPADQQDGGQAAPLTIDIADPVMDDVPAPTAGDPGSTDPIDLHMPSSITIAVGSSGFYSGARPVETLAEYETRMGAGFQKFGDLGWMLGTAPKA